MLTKITLGFLVLVTALLTLLFGAILYSIFYPTGPTYDEIKASVQPVKVLNITLNANSNYDVTLVGKKQFCMALTTPTQAIGPGHLSELQVLVNNVEFHYQDLAMYVRVDPVATWQYKLPFSVDRPLTLEFKPSTKYSGPKQFNANIMVCQTDHLIDKMKSISITKSLRDIQIYFWTFFAMSSLSLLVSSYFFYRIIRK